MSREDRDRRTMEVKSSRLVLIFKKKKKKREKKRKCIVF